MGLQQHPLMLLIVRILQPKSGTLWCLSCASQRFDDYFSIKYRIYELLNSFVHLLHIGQYNFSMSFSSNGNSSQFKSKIERGHHDFKKLRPTKCICDLLMKREHWLVYLCANFLLFIVMFHGQYYVKKIVRFQTP